MQPATTIRNWQFEQMRRSLKIIGNLIAITPLADLTTYRDGGKGWTVLEVVAHLCDFEGIFFDRARVTVDQDTPDLFVPNADDRAKEYRYGQQDLQQTLDAWTQRREDFITYLQGLPEDAWERPSNHPIRGRMTLQDQLLLTTWHDNNHIEQIMHVLAEKKF